MTRATSGYKARATKEPVFLTEGRNGDVAFSKAPVLRKLHDLFRTNKRVATVVIRDPAAKAQPTPTLKEMPEKDEAKGKKKKQRGKKGKDEAKDETKEEVEKEAKEE
jgi:hypothetical protein